MVAEDAPQATSRQDAELTDLLTKLYTIQEDIGAKPKTSDEEKKEKAKNVAVMGKGKKAEKKGTPNRETPTDNTALYQSTIRRM